MVARHLRTDSSVSRDGDGRRERPLPRHMRVAEPSTEDELVGDEPVGGVPANDTARFEATPAQAGAPAKVDPAEGEPAEGEPAARTDALESGEMAEPGVGEEDDQSSEEAIGRNTAMMSVLVVVSRLTGFLRTWGQAFALGVTALASCYSVANALPNTIYELVMGGMLITAFLPVYLSVKREVGRKGANAYASNLLSIVTLLMLALTVISWVFAAQIVWTQSFSASADFDVDLTIYFFRFFVIEIVLYALSSIISGVLNAERDYFWSNAASIFNNVVATASFLLYAALAQTQPAIALLILALGNPLGVLVQVLVQVPSLRKHGVRFTLRVDFRDPRLRETLSIGIPTLVVMLASFPTTAVMTSCALQATAAGASIIYYSRLWFMLPYSIFAIPITVAMFTELSDYIAKGDSKSFVAGIASGTNKILFYLVPFTIYLIVFSPYLITVIGAGRFGPEDVQITAFYLAMQSVQLSLYGVSTYLQKVCSALRKMVFYTVATCIAAAVQIAFCLVFTPSLGIGGVGISSVFYYGPIVIVVLAYLRHDLGPIGMRSMLAYLVKMLLLGAMGGAVGWAITWALGLAIGPSDASLVKSVVYLVAGGIPAVVVTYGLAMAMRIPEAKLVVSLLHRGR